MQMASSQSKHCKTTTTTKQHRNRQINQWDLKSLGFTNKNSSELIFQLCLTIVKLLFKIEIVWNHSKFSGIMKYWDVALKIKIIPYWQIQWYRQISNRIVSYGSLRVIPGCQICIKKKIQPKTYQHNTQKNLRSYSLNLF